MTESGAKFEMIRDTVPSLRRGVYSPMRPFLTEPSIQRDRRAGLAYVSPLVHRLEEFDAAFAALDQAQAKRGFPSTKVSCRAVVIP